MDLLKGQKYFHTLRVWKQSLRFYKKPIFVYATTPDYENPGLDRFSTPTSIVAQEAQLFFCTSKYSSHQNRSYLIPMAVILLSLVCCSKLLLLWFVFMPPIWDCPNFMTSLFLSIPSLDTHQLIFGGDLNLSVNPTLDRLCSRKLTQSKAAKCVSVFTDQIGSVDVQRFFHPTAKEFSFHSQVHQTYPWIDYFFLDKILLPSVKQCE